MFSSAGTGRIAPVRAAALTCLMVFTPSPRFLRRRAGLLRGFLLAGVIGLLAACAAPPLAPNLGPNDTPRTTTAPPPTAPTMPPPQPTVGVVVNEPGAAPGYILFSRNSGNGYYLIDRQGRVVQQWPVGKGESKLARLLENGNLMAMGYGNNRNKGVREIDPAGWVVWQYRLPSQHHDFLLLPNGNVLLLAGQRKSAAAIRDLGADPKYRHGLEGLYLQEIQPAPREGGEVVWEWSVWDHIIQDFDPEKPNYGVVADHPELVDLNFGIWTKRDWLHHNSLAYHPERDQIMLSARNFSEIWIIDRSTTTEEAAGHSGGNSGKGGDLLYRWGNPRAWQAGGYADQRLFLHHDAHWIQPGRPGAGNVLVFNNGSGLGNSPRRGYSSVDELILPAEGYDYRRSPGAAYGPAELEWTYTNPGDFYSHAAGNAQRLPNGNTLFCDRDRGAIWEVTAAGDTVWKYISPLLEDGPARQGEQLKSDDPAEGWDNWVYRAYHYPPDYPGLAELDLTPGEPIELPALP